MTIVNLKNADTESLKRLFLENQDDPMVLQDLNFALKQLNDDEANILQVNVVRRLRALNAPASREVPALPTPHGWVNKALSSRGLKAPTGRAIYTYRLTDVEYKSGLEILRQISNKLVKGSGANRHEGALAYAVSAEWFRRESITTFLRWDDIGSGVLEQLQYQTKRDLAETGREFWERPLIRGRKNSDREYLLSIALEGGFPVRVLEDNSARLGRFLRAIMARATDDPRNGRHLLKIASEESELLPPSYRHSNFIVVSATIAGMLLMLRSWADSQLQALGTPDVARVVILDLRKPDWRSKLPLYIPPKGSGIARLILDDLIAKPLSSISGEVTARRVLTKTGDRWHSAVKLFMDGEVNLERYGFADVRVFVEPAGAIARHLPSRLAVIDPSADRKKTWRIQPVVTLGRPVPVDLEQEISVALRQERLLVSWALPRGEPLRGDILVFKESGEPEVLEYAGKGSVSSGASKLYVLCSSGFVPDSRNSSVRLDFEGERALYEVSTETYFTSPLDDGIYLVRPNATAESRRMEFSSVSPARLRAVDPGLTLHQGPINAVSVAENGDIRPAKAGEIFWKYPLTSQLHATGSGQPLGLVDLRWINKLPNGKTLLWDRIRLAILPGPLQISTSSRHLRSAEVTFAGLSEWSVKPVVTQDRTVDINGHVFKIDFRGAPAITQTFSMAPPSGKPFDVVVDLPLYRPALVDEHGAVLDRRTISMEEIRTITAVSHGARNRLIAQLQPPSGSNVDKIELDVDGVCSLAPLRRHISALRATRPGLDTRIDLIFAGERDPSASVRYKPPLIQSTLDSALLLLEKGQTADGAFARPIAEPWNEIALEQQGAGIWRLPDKLAGPLIAYTRNGPAVSSRPILISAGLLPIAELSGLAAAVLEPDQFKRMEAISSRLEQIAAGRPNSKSDMHWLKNAVSSLRGLSAASLDALTLLPRHPGAMINLLFECRSIEEKQPIFELEDELPFLWIAFPIAAWRSAGENLQKKLFDALVPAFGEAEGTSLVADGLRTAASDLIRQVPGLDGVLSLAGWPIANPATGNVHDVIQAHLKRMASTDHNIRRRETMDPIATAYAGAATAAQLFIIDLNQRYSLAHQPHLLAPFILAGIINGKLNLDDRLLWLLRQSLIEDADYVARALPYCLQR